MSCQPHGIHDPRSTAPAARPGTIRRTTSVDIVRPGGPDGALELRGIGRDALAGEGGRWRRLASGSTTCAIDPAGTVTAITAGPGGVDLSALVGLRAASGFRAALAEVLDPGPLAHQLLDDAPVAALISVFALQRHDPSTVDPTFARPDVCAGWRSGGPIMVEIRDQGHMPVPAGPRAPLDPSPEPDAWHALPTLPPGAMRRRRRLDVRDDGTSIEVSSAFRDTYVEADGGESIVHEYELSAQVDATTWTVLALETTPRVLPWRECSLAATSAARVVGRDVRELREEVRRELIGASTCTHLNDQLRQLADVPFLAALRS
jgi:hypothetical protein